MSFIKRLGGIVASLGLAAATLTLTAEPAAATTWIDIKNSVNSDNWVQAYSITRTYSKNLGPGDHYTVYNGDGGARINIAFDNDTESYQYYYGGSWHACHEGSAPSDANPTNSYSEVTVRNFHSYDCDGRN